MTIQQFDLVKLEAIIAIQQALENTVEAFSITAENASALAVAANEAAEAAASASGNVLFYDTKADADAALSGLVENQIVEVMADEDVSGLRTRYRVETGAFAFKIIIGEAKVSTAAALRAIPYSAMLTTAQTAGSVASGDNGGGAWLWSADSGADDNTGTVVKPTYDAEGNAYSGTGRWVRVYDGAVRVAWFGRDNAALQAAVTTGNGRVELEPGVTYTISTAVSLTTAGQTLVCTGATLTLTNSATTHYLVRGAADDLTVEGGTFNGNRANNTATSDGKHLVSLVGNHCTIKDATITNARNVGAYCEGSYNTVQNCTIEALMYGVLMGGTNISQEFFHNSVEGCNINMSAGTGAYPQLACGVLITTFSGQTNNQSYWRVVNNHIIGTSNSSAVSSAQCIGVRGKHGLCQGNITYHGFMGFSEGGDYSIISNNCFFDVSISDLTTYGIELTGDNMVVSGNTVTGANTGILWSSSSPTGTFNDALITGNSINFTTVAFLIQARNGASYARLNILNNYFYSTTPSPSAGYQRFLAFEGQGNTINISGNTFKGAASYARGLYIAQASTGDINLSVTNNLFANMSTPLVLSSGSGVLVSSAFAANNVFVNCTSPNDFSRTWYPGTGPYGADVISLNNVGFNSGSGIEGATYNQVDLQAGLTVRYGAGSPENAVTAGIGSLYIRTDGAAGTVLYIKETGTGNTGWAAK